MRRISLLLEGAPTKVAAAAKSELLTGNAVWTAGLLDSCNIGRIFFFNINYFISIQAKGQLRKGSILSTQPKKCGRAVDAVVLKLACQSS